MKLPDEAKTVLIRTVEGRFKGQATYWRRDGKWDLIGVTKAISFLHDVPFDSVESEAEERGLKCEWRKASEFLVKPNPPIH